MSGYWSIEKVENCEGLWVELEPNDDPLGLVPMRTTTDGKKQWLDWTTVAINWTLPFVELEEITADNLEETFLRVRMLELAKGPFLTVENKPVYITLEDLRRRIGLQVAAGIALRSFEANVLASLRRRANEELDEAKGSA